MDLDPPGGEIGLVATASKQVAAVACMTSPLARTFPLLRSTPELWCPEDRAWVDIAGDEINAPN